MAAGAVGPPGDAREDWRILRALSQSLGQPLPFDDIWQLREALVSRHPAFAAIDRLEPAPWRRFGRAGAADAFMSLPFASPIENFYMTDPISRASETMAECAGTFLGHPGKTGTDG